ncbi:ATP-dependent DNA helicase [Streptomyces reniochalinae]|uniref:DNA 3'-5' helicase n=1 Tax=Streptomyces reniochalinae TaxID=2250578 RepID=A0A367EZI9_9ACTN|nr:ATP-dependent DNA helicase [Streptomyces reniochalinae]RCG22590.1 ATP-dependent helicase [Streptomyces reniochalinae]
MPAPLTDPGQLAELLGIPFTPEQTACITAPPAPQVIVAGAGSGKTTVMAARVVWLVGTGQVAPDRVLGLTFTNKAAGELADRVRKALHRAGVTDPDPAVPGSAEAGEPQISTYHAFAGRLLSEHGLRLGIEPSVRLLADATRFQLAAGVLRAAEGPYEALTKSVPALVEDVLALDAELSEHLVTPERARGHDAELLASLEGARLTNDKLRKVPQATRAREELLDLVETYRARKRERERIDFGDQIALAARLAGLPDVGRALREQYSVVLLDEYQDTSVAQRVMLAGLFGQGTGHPVTAVGDPCQAIYGWRGASVANLDDFPRHFPHADGSPARRQSLSENRRSGGRLLTLANGLAAPLRERHEGVEALRPAPDAAGAGRVRAALLDTQAQEIDWLADSLAHLVRTGTPPGEIAVLCRGAGDFAQIQGALAERELPVEVVGLSGLLHLPEIADLVAVCEVLQDPTSNAALVRLLTGPRWRIGPRDLALLGRRAALLVAHQRGGTDADPDERLAAAVEGADPAEVRSLADALDTFLESEGHDDELPFSAEARVRFARLAAELRELRRSLADPLMDVLHRVLAATGLEVELAASPQAVAARRRETLGQFLDIAAGFASLDGEATLLAFLAFLRTAVQYEKGLDSSLPGGENTVKVLTAHKSKGLEWDVVAVPGLVAKQFPSEQARETWLAQPKVLPYALRGDAATLPPAPEWNAKSLKAHENALRAHQATEELRLGYVTFTRPRSLLLGSGHWWGPAQKRPRGPSAFLESLRAHCEADPAHGEVEHWADPPEEDAVNPALEESAEERAWPLPLDPSALARRRAAADAVLSYLQGAPADGAAADARREGETEAGAERLGAEREREGESEGERERELDREREGECAGERESDTEGERERGAEREPGREPGADGVADESGAGGLTPEEARLAAAWDRDLEALTGELRRSREAVRDVPLPRTLSATQLLRVAADPEAFARELARPMPRPPRPAAARRGTRFHAWVESRFEELTLPMLGPDELPGADGEGTDGGEPPSIADERDLAALKEAFERSPYAHRTPYRVEAPFQLMLAGRVIRGRIDAVYRDRAADGGVMFDIVDWKTGRGQDADPLQLAVYRLAWAEQHGLPLSSVSAGFLYVRSGELVRPEGLPDRADLERLLTGSTAGTGGTGGTGGAGATGGRRGVGSSGGTGAQDMADASGQAGGGSGSGSGSGGGGGAGEPGAGHRWADE